MSVRNAPAVGIRLKSVREARGISLHQIAENTKIATRTLEAIERGDFAKLPGGIYTRSVIRSYASCVDLDPETVLNDFLVECPGRVEPAPTREPDPEERARAGFRLLGWTAAMLPRVRTVALPAVVACVAGYAVLAWNTRVEVLPSSAVDGFAAHGLSAAPVEPAVTRVAQLLHQEFESSLFAGASALTLEVQSDAPCWISLRADDGETGARLLGAGERAVIEAEREIVLKVGDAGAVSLWINGRPVRPLGPTGKVVTTRITADNLPEYLGG